MCFKMKPFIIYSLVGLAGLEPAAFGLEMLLRFELKSP